MTEQLAEYGSQFAVYEPALGAEGPDWLGEARRSAYQRFRERGGLPTRRDEEFKYTRLTALEKLATKPVLRPPSEASDSLAAALDRLEDAPADSPRLVFVNGHLSEALSRRADVPEGVRLSGLAEVLRERPETVRPQLEALDHPFHHALNDLNGAFFQDGAVVEVSRGAVVERPILLVFASTNAGVPLASHPRNLILVGETAQLTVVETYLGLAEAPYVTNALTDIRVSQGAALDHCRVQRESLHAFHLGTVQADLSRDSRFVNHNVSLGGRLVRNDLNARVLGEGADCRFNGLYMAKGSQHVDNHTAIDHAVPHTQSAELYKGVLDEQATGVFNGKVFVRQDAQKTNAQQSNKNLMLSERATINTKPQLEIWADDVRCTHGATIGQIDREALFFMRSRGVPLVEARSLLTFAFANEILSRLRVDVLRERLEREVSGWLPKPVEKGAP